MPVPSEEELAEFYQGFLYRQPDPQSVAKLIESEVRELQKFVDSDFHLSRQISFLDYGGGTGIAASAGLKLGYDVHYFEIDHESRDFVSRNVKIDPNKVYSAADQIPISKFDLVLCDNVIEHVRDPKLLINELRSYLKPGGLLVVKTPNCRNTELYFFPMISLFGYALRSWRYSHDARQALRTFTSRTWNCDPPRHLFSFSKESLTKICNALCITEFAFQYRHTPVYEYLTVIETLRSPQFLSLSWHFRLLVGLMELATKPIYLLLRGLGALRPSEIVLIVTNSN